MRRLPVMLMEFLVSQALGGLGYQSFHQRILSSNSLKTAKIICLAAAVLILILAIPLVLIGAAAASTGRNKNDDIIYLQMTD